MHNDTIQYQTNTLSFKNNISQTDSNCILGYWYVNYCSIFGYLAWYWKM